MKGFLSINRSPDGGDGNGGDGNGAAGDVQQQLAEAQQKIGALEQDKKTLGDTKTDLEQRLDDADKELLGEDYLNFKEGKSKPAGSSGDEAGGGGDLDLDRASNREIVSYIATKHKGDLEAAVKDIKSSIDSNKQSIGMIAAQFDVALASLRHGGSDGKPSWAENEKAIFEIAKSNPTWKAEECYKHFCIQKKAADDEKAVADKKKTEEDDAAVTEKAGAPNSTVTDKEVTADEAGAIAYKKAFGNAE